MKKQYIIGGIVLYLLSAAISYFIFTAVQKSGGEGSVSPVTSPLPKDVGGQLVFDDNLPKTEPCPLTGKLYSVPQREWWEKHRPLGIMIENHEEARPQSGISSADIVYEVVAEGGITRFLAIFYCQDGGMVGPVRSARTYFLDFISEYGDKSLYVHVGGANVPGPANALGQINDYGWAGKNDINQFSVGFPTFWRDYERLGHTVSTEHTMYSTTDKLWKVAAERELTNVDVKNVSWDKAFTPWKFKDGAGEGDRGTSSPSFSFWKGYSQYDVVWEYSKAENLYKRTNGGQPHLDKDNDKQVMVSAIVVLFMAETSLNDDEKHLLYKTKGSGRALYFFDGNVVGGTWEKIGREARTKLLDENGKPVTLTRGQLWIEVLPAGNDVSY